MEWVADVGRAAGLEREHAVRVREAEARQVLERAAVAGDAGARRVLRAEHLQPRHVHDEARGLVAEEAGAAPAQAVPRFSNFTRAQRASAHDCWLSSLLSLVTICFRLSSTDG